MRPAWAVVLPGCAASHLLPPEQACEEVGTAIGARLAEQRDVGEHAGRLT